MKHSFYDVKAKAKVQADVTKELLRNNLFI